MLEKEKIIIIDKIQNSSLDLCINLSGCGFKFLNSILKQSGASKFLINAEIPYSINNLENFYDVKKPFVSLKNAQKLSYFSYDKFLKFKNKKILLSIGCIGSIKTFYEKKGEEKVSLYFKSSNNQEYGLNLKFNKNKKNSREFQDEIINIFILDIVNKFINENYIFHSRSKGLNNLKSISSEVVIVEEKLNG